MRPLVVSTFISLLLNTLVHLSSGQTDGCRSVDGRWYNQLGSEMILNHTREGEIFGEYRTAVEREAGAAGHSHSRVEGASPYNKVGATVGFAVMFNNGASITVWTGQCLVCDGAEVLVSSWLLRERVHTCLDKWKSTRIGQDVFTRTEEVPGPRKAHDGWPGYTHANNVAQLTDERTKLSMYGLETRNERTKRSVYGLETRNERTKRSVYGLETPCSLQGTWYNEMGSEIILQHNADNTITGEYRTAVERTKGAAGTTHSRVYGLGNVYSAETTFALFVVWRGGASVTGWVGQCHLCGETEEETLQVNWLLRSQVTSCDDNWKATNYGQNSFTRQPQKEGPRKHLGIHTPQQEGEDDQSQAFATCGSAPSAHTNGLLAICLLIACAAKQQNL